ncbi:MAG: N-acyl homoserine lactonase family protein [Thermomicrobiales bacterium]
MRLYLLLYGTNSANGTPYPGYLIQTDDGTNVLVDTGFPPEATGAYRTATGPGPRVEEGQYVLNQLAALGLAPKDIKYLIATHLDGDHAGNHDQFPDAEIVIQKEHLDAARQLERFQATRAHWDAPGLHYRTVEGDTELLPGIELIASGGHKPGHQSVLVRLPETGPVLLAIDAIPRMDQRDPETRTIGPADMDEANTRASTKKLMDLAAREGVTLIIHGHDPEQWKTLKLAPDYYS